jgi:hypothetical protein
MIHRFIVVIITILIPFIGFTQEKKEFHPEIRLSVFFANAGPIGGILESYSGGMRTEFIRGNDLQMVFPTRFRNFSWIGGTFYFEGEESTGGYYYINKGYSNQLLGGALYTGPQLSTNFRYVNLEVYLAGCIFSVNDELTVTQNQEVLFNSASNYTAPGIKSGFNLKLRYKHVGLYTGFSFFITSGKESTLFYKVVDFGLSYKF